MSEKPLTLPCREGPYPVAVTTFVLATKQSNPLALEDSNRTDRQLPLSIYQPTNPSSHTGETTSSYMPPLLESFYDENFTQYSVPKGTIARVRVSSAAAATSQSNYLASSPLLVFSHGSMATRLFYQSIVPAVASAGYTVISLDHTDDAAAVELPGASELATNRYDPARDWTAPPETWDAYLGNVVARMRGGDINAVLDAVEAGAVPGLERYATGGDVQGSRLRAGVWGHSLGGCSAVWAAALDGDRGRIVGMANLDGAVLGDARTSFVPHGVPYLGIGAAASMGHPTGPPVTWDELWETLGDGYKRRIVLDGAAHLSFTDIPAMADGLGFRDVLPQGKDSMIGPISGDRVRTVVYRYVTEFFDMLLRGGDGELLNGTSKDFPEIRFEYEDELPRHGK